MRATPIPATTEAALKEVRHSCVGIALEDFRVPPILEYAEQEGLSLASAVNIRYTGLAARALVESEIKAIELVVKEIEEGKIPKLSKEDFNG